MLSTHLRIAFRNLAKNKAHTLINITGLALGIAATIVIVLYARYELTYDQFHENSENIYLVYKERLTPTGMQPTYDTWVPLLDKLKNDFPDIEAGTQIDYSGITIENTIGAEILLPIASSPRYQEFRESWGASYLFTFISLPETASPAALTEKFPQLIQNIWNEEIAERTNFKLLPLHGAYDTFVGDSSQSYLLLYIALGIILIAAANYMNLSTARSMLRAREVGMRKVLGARKGQLVVQFLTEAMIITFLALVLGVFLAELALPSVNGLMETDLFIPYFSQPWVWGLLALSGLILGLLAGSYPAFFLSNFRILKSLRRSFTDKTGGIGVRNGLIVFQFGIAVLLVIGALAIAQQLRFMQEADLAFNKENLLAIPVSQEDFEDSEEVLPRLETFRSELASHPAILSAASSRHVPGRWSGSNTFVEPEGWEADPLRMRFTYKD